MRQLAAAVVRMSALLHGPVHCVSTTCNRPTVTTRDAARALLRTSALAHDQEQRPVSLGVRRTRRDALLAAAVITTTLPAALAPVAVAEGAALAEGLEGLRYADEVVGKGPQPFEGDVVKVNYEARLAETGEPSARSVRRISTCDESGWCLESQERTGVPQSVCAMRRCSYVC